MTSNLKRREYIARDQFHLLLMKQAHRCYFERTTRCFQTSCYMIQSMITWATSTHRLLTLNAVASNWNEYVCLTFQRRFLEGYCVCYNHPFRYAIKTVYISHVTRHMS